MDDSFFLLATCYGLVYIVVRLALAAVRRIYGRSIVSDRIVISAYTVLIFVSFPLLFLIPDDANPATIAVVMLLLLLGMILNSIFSIVSCSRLLKG